MRDVLACAVHHHAARLRTLIVFAVAERDRSRILRSLRDPVQRRRSILDIDASVTYQKMRARRQGQHDALMNPHGDDRAVFVRVGVVVPTTIRRGDGRRDGRDGRVCRNLIRRGGPRILEVDGLTEAVAQARERRRGIRCECVHPCRRRHARRMLMKM